MRFLINDNSSVEIPNLMISALRLTYSINKEYAIVKKHFLNKIQYLQKVFFAYDFTKPCSRYQ